MTQRSQSQLSPEEQLQLREAKQRLSSLLLGAEEAHAEGRLAQVIRDTPGVREQLRSRSDA